MIDFKTQVFQAAIDLLEERNKLLSDELKSLQVSLNEDTKSSAGDKYETGREMIRQEIDKVENQHQQNQTFLLQIRHLFDSMKPTSKISEGSLLCWGQDWMLISVSLGQIMVGGKKVFLLSKSSPLGQALLGKSKNDQVSFRGNSKLITEVF